jgi:ABC-2 type transport system permease protein
MGVVAERELRDLWLGGRGLLLAFAFSLLLSVLTYLAASNEALNFLEQRETVNLVLQVAVGVGGLLALLGAADAISGERERGTLESLLVTPLPRARLVGGKLVAALSLWLGAFVVTVPYVWFLGRNVGAAGEAIGVGLVAGTLLAAGLAAFGICVSARARSNRVSLSVCLFVLLALFAPTQLPAGAQHGWFGEVLLRVNPVTAAEHYISSVTVDQHGWTHDLSWLASPLIAAVVFTAIAVAVVPRVLMLTLVLLLAFAAPAQAAPDITMSRTHIATRLGEEFAFTSVVTNRGATPLTGLIAHLDIVSRDSSVYVDPEDWSDERTRYLAPLAPGRSVTVPWRVKAVTSGRLDAYVVVLAGGRPTVGPAIDVRVANRSTIDAGGALQLAIAVPALLGLALVGVRARRPR